MENLEGSLEEVRSQLGIKGLQSRGRGSRMGKDILVGGNSWAESGNLANLGCSGSDELGKVAQGHVMKGQDGGAYIF